MNIVKIVAELKCKAIYILFIMGYHLRKNVRGYAGIREWLLNDIISSNIRKLQSMMDMVVKLSKNAINDHELQNYCESTFRTSY